MKIISERVKLPIPGGKSGMASIDDDGRRALVIAGSPEEFTDQLKAIVAQDLAETDEEKDAAIARRWDTDAPPDAHGRIYPKRLLEAVEREVVEERRQQPAWICATPGRTGIRAARPDRAGQ